MLEALEVYRFIRCPQLVDYIENQRMFQDQCRRAETRNLGMSLEKLGNIGTATRSPCHQSIRNASKPPTPGHLPYIQVPFRELRHVLKPIPIVAYKNSNHSGFYPCRCVRGQSVASRACRNAVLGESSGTVEPSQLPYFLDS